MFSTLKTPPPIPVPRPELTPSVLDALMSEVPVITGAAPVRRNCIRLGIELGWGFCARMYAQYMEDQFARRLEALQKQNQAMVGVIIDMTAQGLDAQNLRPRAAVTLELANAGLTENPAKKHDGGEL